jgi:hypothetical protein
LGIYSAISVLPRASRYSRTALSKYLGIPVLLGCIHVFSIPVLPWVYFPVSLYYLAYISRYPSATLGIYPCILILTWVYIQVSPNYLGHISLYPRTNLGIYPGIPELSWAYIPVLRWVYIQVSPYCLVEWSVGITELLMHSFNQQITSVLYNHLDC